MHGLVDAAALGDEPVVDAAERGQDLPADTGFLGDLADGGLFGGLALFDVALGQRPQHPSAPVDPADQRGHLSFGRAVDAVDDQPARGGLVHGAQPRGGATRRARPAGFARPGLAVAAVGGGGGDCGVGGFRGGGVRCGGICRTCRATAAAPTPAPSWFGLFAVRHPSDSSWHGMAVPPALAGSESPCCRWV